jgi:hypothetical protein
MAIMKQRKQRPCFSSTSPCPGTLILVNHLDNVYLYIDTGRW